MNCEKIVYSNFSSSSIDEITDIYQMMQVIAGVNEFVNFGRATTLTRLYKEQETVEIEKVLWSMREFSDAIGMCAIGDITEILENLRTNLEELKENTSEKPLLQEIFCSMIPMIQEKLPLEFGGIDQYPDLLQWCLEHELLQQAVTLFVEKIPKYLYEKKMIPDEWDVTRKKGTKSYEQDEWMEKFWDGAIEYLRLHTEVEELYRLIENCEDGLVILVDKKGVLKTQTIQEADQQTQGVTTDKRLYPKEIEKWRGAGVERLIKGLSVSFLDKLRVKNKSIHKGELAIEYLKKVWKEGNCTKRQFDLVCYYVAIKMIRNQMNHANTVELQPRDEHLILYLKQNLDEAIDFRKIDEKQPDQTPKLDYCKIKMILEKAVAAL